MKYDNYDDSLLVLIEGLKVKEDILFTPSFSLLLPLHSSNPPPPPGSVIQPDIIIGNSLSFF
jgi:hypothetical protein